MTTTDVQSNKMLISLILSKCGLTEVTELRLPNLHHLDISFNQLRHLDLYKLLDDLPVLDTLSLGGNPLTDTIFQPSQTVLVGILF